MTIRPCPGGGFHRRARNLHIFLCAIVLLPSAPRVQAVAQPDSALEDGTLSTPSQQAAVGSAAAATELETIVVSGKRSLLSFDQPQTGTGVTATQLRRRVFINTEDALRHLPSVSVRKRYIGDRNGLLSGRSFNALQAPRGVVYADGVLLSNFLGRFNAPRWSMVAPEEVARVDVLYGPYSALYPGNSIGTTVLITTREPDVATASGRAQYFTQSFSLFGHERSFDGNQLSAYIGGRGGPWSGSLGVNRLDSEGHPMQYATGRLVTAPTAAQRTAAVPVTGAIEDLDPRRQPRLIVGPSGGSMEDDLQHQLRARIGYQAEKFRIDAQAGYWRNGFDRRGESFLRAPDGSVVTRGIIRVDDRIFTVADSAFGPETGDEEHLMTALTARTQFESDWNVSVAASRYSILDDALRANVPAGSGASENLRAGTLIEGASGDGWWNLDAQMSYEREDHSHSLTFGYYHSLYRLDTERYATDDWRSGRRGALLEDAEGATRVQALYLQDVWRIASRWSLTAGLRAERWRAFDGRRANALAPGGLSLPGRTEHNLSPKLSVTYAPSRFALRYSIGRGVRYPTVAELFQGSIGTTTVNGEPVATIVNNDPGLEPEDALSQELALEAALSEGQGVRVSLFRDDIDDTIHFQTNINVTPTVTNLQNVERVLTRGIEVEYRARDLLPGLDIDANVSLRDSTIEKNSKNPALEGKDWVRIPKVQANLVADWRFAPGWNVNLSVLHVGDTHGELDNGDQAGCNRFGCTQGQTTIDTRVGYRFGDRYELGLGVHNLTDEKYFEFHPFPQRTFLFEIRVAR